MPERSAGAAAGAAAPAGAGALRKVRARLVSFLALLYFAAFLDRVNVGFAAAQMHRDLGFSDAVYGFGAGIFFLSYSLFEIPSNLLLHRFGARRWIGRIMLSWGVLAGLMAFVRSAGEFYALRLLLGVAEAGFFPGILYYLTYWIPTAHRARLVGTFMVAIPLSTAVSGPLSAAILTLDGRLGIAGWRWLFVLETVPSLVLGLLTLRHLTDTPAQARWLSGAERDWLTATLAAERAAAAPGGSALAWRSLLRPRLAALCACYFGADLGLYGIVLWIPQIYAASGMAPGLIGYAVAVPYALAAIGMVLWARRSDRRGERTRHMALAACAGFAGLAASAFLHDSPLATVAAFTVGVTGTLAMLPVFWTLPAALLRGATAAAGIALINAVGNIGSFVGPAAVGWLKQASGSFTLSLLAVASGVLASAVIALGLREHPA